MDRKKRLASERRRRILRRAEVVWDAMRKQALRWILVASLLIGAIAFGFLLFSPIVQVREVKVSRQSPRLDIEEVQTALAPLFGKHLFFLSSFEVASLLHEHIPDVQTITMSKAYPDTLQVSIALHPLVARLHIADPDDPNPGIGTGATIDFLTDQGTYIATTAARDIETLPELIIVDWGVRPDPGASLLTTGFLERMNAAELTLLRQFGQEVTRRVVYLRAQEFHLRVGNIDLWFDTKSPLTEQMQRYRLLLSKIDIAEVRGYIDLRIADRIIYQ